MKYRDIIVYDIETNRLIKGREWKAIDCSLFGSAVAYSFNSDRYYFFLHPDSIKSLVSLLRNNIVVTYNGVNFDSKISLGRYRSVSVYLDSGLKLYCGDVSWIEYDILVQCLKSIKSRRRDIDAYKLISPGGLKLDEVAERSIGRRKTVSGTLAPVYYQQGRYDKLLEYNFNDVVITKELLIHLVRNLRLRGRGVRVNIRRDRFYCEHLAKISESI